MTARRHDHLKLLSGTGRPDRAAPETPALPVLDAVPSAPPWLTNIDAVKEWNRLAGVLVANRLLHDGNISVFAQLCALHGRLVQIWNDRETPTAALLAGYRSLSASLGLLGMALSAHADKPNRFANNAKRMHDDATA